MALFLVRAVPGKHEQRNSSQVNAYIVDAADAAGARVAAAAAAPNGESLPKPSWEAVALDAALTPLLVQGIVVRPAAAEQLRGQ